MLRNIPSEKLPNVSVVILTYNGSEYIEALLASLFEQSYPADRMEIIVVDNASTDNTVSIVKGYPQVRCIRLDKNMGFAAGNNHATQYAQHDFLAFLNQDTICHQGWLSGLMAAILEDEGIGACTSNMLMPGSEEFRHADRHLSLNSLCFYDLCPFGYARYRKTTGKRLVSAKILSGCSFVIRRETVVKLGYLFDSLLWMYVEDTDLSLRIHNQGQRIYAVRDSIVWHLHDSDVQMKPNRLRIAARAIMNRVFVFFKNMSATEFLLFFPILLVGGIFKLFEFHLTPLQKAFYFLPFAFFSVFCMVLAIFHLPKYVAKRRYVLNRRTVKGLHILRIVFQQNA